MKTKEEILKEWQNENSAYIHEDDCLGAMQAYADQCTPKWIECKHGDFIDNGHYMFSLYNPATDIRDEVYMKISNGKVSFGFATHYCKITLPNKP